MDFEFSEEHEAFRKVVRDFAEQIRLVRDQLRVEKGAALEGTIGQNPLTKTVDGVDRRLIEVHQRGFKSCGGSVTVRVCLQQTGEEFVVRPAGPKGCDRVSQSGANPFAQLGRRQFGESRDQDAVNRQLWSFEQKAQNQTGNRERFPGPGARFD